MNVHVLRLPGCRSRDQDITPEYVNRVKRYKLYWRSFTCKDISERKFEKHSGSETLVHLIIWKKCINEQMANGQQNYLQCTTFLIFFLVETCISNTCQTMCVCGHACICDLLQPHSASCCSSSSCSHVFGWSVYCTPSGGLWTGRLRPRVAAGCPTCVASASGTTWGTTSPSSRESVYTWNALKFSERTVI